MLTIHETVPLVVEGLPERTRQNGHEDFVVQDLRIEAHNICYRRLRFLLPDGTFCTAPLPAHVQGHFGPTLRSHVLNQHYQNHVTQPLIREELLERGIDISTGQIDRRLTMVHEEFHAEKDGLLPFIALLLEDKVGATVGSGHSSTAKTKPRLGRSFILLFVANLTVGLASFVTRLGRSLVMNDLGFSAAAISSTAAFGGAITLPLPLLLGWLSDRVGRKRVMVVGYLAGTLGLSALAIAVSLWHFWIAISLMNIMSSVRSIGSALVADLVPKQSLGKGMSLFAATTWVGGIIGFAGTGYAVEQLGMISTWLVGAFLPLIAIALLIFVPTAPRPLVRCESR